MRAANVKEMYVDYELDDKYGIFFFTLNDMAVLSHMVSSLSMILRKGKYKRILVLIVESSDW